jgi:hypothetical protein
MTLRRSDKLNAFSWFHSYYIKKTFYLKTTVSYTKMSLVFILKVLRLFAPFFRCLFPIL